MSQETSETARSRRDEKGHTHARRGSLTGDYQPPAGGGSHFKPAAAAQTQPGSKAVAPVPRFDSTPTTKGPQRQGVSGREQPSNVPTMPYGSSKKKKRAGGKASPYSRYNTRYAEISSAGLRPDGMAFDWWPYCIYGAVAVLLTLVWCVVSIVSAHAVQVTMALVGIVLLCAIVVAGLGLAVTLSLLTLRREEGLEAMDVWATAVGRIALMMVGSVVIWILASAIISL